MDLTVTRHGADSSPKTAENAPPSHPRCNGATYDSKYPCRLYAAWKVLYATQAQIDAGEGASGLYSCGKHLHQVCQTATEGHGIEFAQVHPLV